MKNIASFNTAISLRDAGFPQPKLDHWQCWHDTFGTLYCIIDVFGDGTAMCIDDRLMAVRLVDVSDFVFAPTTEDILRELGLNYALSIDKNGAAVVQSGGGRSWTSSDAVSACAEVWMEIHGNS